MIIFERQNRREKERERENVAPSDGSLPSCHNSQGWCRSSQEPSTQSRDSHTLAETQVFKLASAASQDAHQQGAALKTQ